MVHASLLVERCYWLGAGDFSAAGLHRAITDVQIDRADRRFDHLAPKVRLGHDAVGIEPVI
jgi:hypothetical protein